MNTIFNLQRSGMVVNERRCGLEGHTLTRYTAEITVRDLILDRDKFMVDHDDIHSLVSDSIRLGVTCEVACLNALKNIEEHFTKPYFITSRMSLLRIKFTLGMVGGDANFTITRTYNN